MKKTTIATKLYYFYFADPKAASPTARRVLGENFKAIAADREAKKKKGLETDFIRHYTEQVTAFSK